jgi:hypothetical protein
VSLILLFRVLLATIWDMGHCPCPQCKILKVNFSNLGLVGDTHARHTEIHTYASDIILQARNFIYQLGEPVSSIAVERLLQAQSLVPTEVRFSSRAGVVACLHIIERICKKTWSIWFPYFFNARGVSHARIRTGCLESGVHTSPSYLKCCSSWENVDK